MYWRGTIFGLIMIRSTLVDDKKSRAENDAKLKIAKEFILDPANMIKADNKFSLIKVF